MAESVDGRIDPAERAEHLLRRQVTSAYFDDMSKEIDGMRDLALRS